MSVHYVLLVDGLKDHLFFLSRRKAHVAGARIRREFGPRYRVSRVRIPDGIRTEGIVKVDRYNDTRTGPFLALWLPPSAVPSGIETVRPSADHPWVYQGLVAVAAPLGDFRIPYFSGAARW